MSDETTELQSLSKLKIAGRLRYWRGTIEISETELHAICDEIQAEHDQAIAATLGSERHPYEQRITGDGSDWGEIMRDAYDDLMASACESCTPEQMEQLADYIRAELGSGTCELHDCDGSFSVVSRPVWRCDCGAFMTQYTDATTYHKPRFCPSCGAKAVGR